MAESSNDKVNRLRGDNMQLRRNNRGLAVLAAGIFTLCFMMVCGVIYYCS
jgi:hypothetical protein